MSGEKRAPTQHAVNDLISRRWSPRAISDRAVDRRLLAGLFEAARWAPSCFNEQPWRYVLAMREDRAWFDAVAGCLGEGNAWARGAGVLVIGVASLTFARNGKPNAHALHDLGAASENLCLQAVDLGLCAHQMAGFDRARARALLGLGEGHEPVTMIAIGHAGDPAALPEGLRQREEAPRDRRPLEAFVFEGGWGTPAKIG